ncbi:hypothetical protein [Mycobacterium sp. IS-1556]|uniref:hypothetical protein n=1 Tax=Mycobacterium sp. IS-1556 TaxID=1772276 RepID=UPI00074162C1|nr:hypothetical protein [Mycobacterium sp. IS-1556]KUH84788.1 hypothetical protein AU187_19935 [Mycobacterium sp. IS-1556]
MEVLDRKYGVNNFMTQIGSDDYCAVIDTDGEFVTVNWSTGLKVWEFFETTTSHQDVTHSFITYGLGKHQIESTKYPIFYPDILMTSAFESECNFLRLDVSETRTFEWQSLLAPSGPILIGMGDRIDELRHPLQWGRIESYIRDTVNKDDLVGLIKHTLVSRYIEPRCIE